MATRIQARWRGFASRKYVHSFIDRRRYIQRMRSLNHETRNQLAEAEVAMRETMDRRLRETKRKEAAARLSRMHHMLSTAHVKGILAAKMAGELIETEFDDAPLEKTVQMYSRELPRKLIWHPTAVEEKDASTIRLAGRYDALKEERTLQRRLDVLCMATTHPEPFVSSIK